MGLAMGQTSQEDSRRNVASVWSGRFSGPCVGEVWSEWRSVTFEREDDSVQCVSSPGGQSLEIVIDSRDS
jgi:hypothetical protein